MPSIAADIQSILELAGQYSSGPTPAMLEREAAAGDLERQLSRALPGLAESAGFPELQLSAKAGGRQSNFSPVAWVRIFSPQYAPTAQEGTYLVYLFGADGSRAYLSLMQGTSEYRSGKMRTINDRRVVLEGAAVARAELGDLMESEAAAGAVLSTDLGWRQLTSYDSRRRARAYEDATILAYEYRGGHIPDDQVLLADIVRMLPLLAQLYGSAPLAGHVPEPSGGPDSEPPTGARPKRWLMDPEKRTGIEVYAEDHAIAYLTRLGWKVKRVGHLKRGYDLACKNSVGEKLHVEVKGTQTRGDKVTLTHGEVRHVRDGRCEADHALYVVSEIEVSRDGDNHCSGGKPTRFLPWVIEDSLLFSTEYEYTLPS